MAAQNNSNSDNTDAEKGFAYQALYALKIFFENSNENTWELGYETNGDITIWNGSVPITYIECKHHKNDGNLTNSSVDFWKTIKNMYNDLTDATLPTFENYKLITTENEKIDYKNAYDKEPNYSDEDALFNFVTTSFKKSKDNKGNVKYFNVEYNDAKLMELLNKFCIVDNQPKLNDLCLELYKYFTMIPNNENKRKLVLYLSAEIDRGTLFTDSQNRKITFLQLKKVITELSPRYQKKELVLEKPHDNFSSNEEHYIDNLHTIGLKNAVLISDAKKDFLFTIYNKLENLEGPIIFKSVNEYEEEINRTLRTVKARNCVKKLGEIDNYFDSIQTIEKSDHRIIGVETKEIYHRGTTHYLVNEKKHTWQYEEQDE